VVGSAGGGSSLEDGVVRIARLFIGVLTGFAAGRSDGPVATAGMLNGGLGGGSLSRV
jgi:hypothetical protein